MTFRMLYATDVMLFLMDDSAEDRVDTETERVPSLDCRNAPLPRTFCHRDWMNEFFKKRIEQDYHTADIVHSDGKAFLTGEESLHVFNAYRNTEQMISIGASHYTFHLFRGKITTKRKRESRRSVDTGRTKRRQRFRGVIHPFQLHALIKREIRCGKAGLDGTGALGQQPLDNVDVHFVAVPAGRMVTVYVPVSVYEIVHIAVVLFTTQHNIVEINCFCFGKQGEKFIRHILVRSEVLQVLAPSKKREGRLQVFSCRFTFLSL